MISLFTSPGLFFSLFDSYQFHFSPSVDANCGVHEHECNVIFFFFLFFFIFFFSFLSVLGKRVYRLLCMTLFRLSSFQLSPVNFCYPFSRERFVGEGKKKCDEAGIE